MVRAVIVPDTSPPSARCMRISTVRSSRPSYLPKTPLPEGDVNVTQPPQVPKAGTAMGPPKSPVPCSTRLPPTPPSQNFQVNCGDTATAAPSPLLRVTLTEVT